MMCHIRIDSLFNAIDVTFRPPFEVLFVAVHARNSLHGLFRQRQLCSTVLKSTIRELI